MSKKKTYQFKLVLLGDTSVGKSSLVIRFVKGQFLEYQESTIGAAFLTQSVTLDGCVIKFEIWDTAGQERYHSLAPMYYKGAAAAIVVFDITSRASFKRAEAWIKELQTQGNDDVLIALAGNKVDRREEREVSTQDAQHYATTNGIFYLETSAKENINIEDLFMEIARRLPKGSSKKNEDRRILLDNSEFERGDKKCC